jgi:hypothetical protein
MKNKICVGMQGYVEYTWQNIWIKKINLISEKKSTLDNIVV